MLKQLDQFLAQFSAMITQQRLAVSQQNIGNAEAALLKQMLHAQAVVENRRRELRLNLKDRSLDRFVHELWSLSGDMSHFDFDVNHLVGADVFVRLREEIALESLTLTKDLSDAAHRAVLMAELGQ